MLTNILRNVNVSTLRRRVLILALDIYLHTNKCSFSIFLKDTAKKRCKQQQLRYTFFTVFDTVEIPLNISDIYNSKNGNSAGYKAKRSTKCPTICLGKPYNV